MKHLKKLFPALLALALLTGCGGDRYTLKTTIRVPTGDDAPVTSPAQPISAPAVVTEGRVPLEDDTLPVEKTDMSVWDMDTTALLAETEDGTGAFYGTPNGTALLQWDGSLAEFDWNFVTSHRVPPQVWCFDADGDGQEEMVVTCYWGGGTGVSIYALHVVEKNQDGSLTDYCLPDTLYGEQLSALLSTAAVGDCTYAVLGNELVDITRQLPENLEVGDVLGLNTSDYAAFNTETGSILYRGSAWLARRAYRVHFVM